MGPTRQILLILIIAAQLTSYAQTQRKVYFDENWKVVSSTNNYKYYRVVNLNSSGYPVAVINTYYSSGTLQWRGRFQSRNIECSSCEQCSCTGLCTWYHPNGQKQSEAFYEDGKATGETKYWDENGLEISIAEKASSEVVLKSLIESNVKDGKYDQLEGIWVGDQESQMYIDKKPVPVKTIPRHYAILRLDNDYMIIEINIGKSDLEITSGNGRGEFRATIPNFEGVAKFTDSNNLRIVMEASKAGILKLLGNQYIDIIDEVEIYTEIKLHKSYPLRYDLDNIKANAIKEAPKSGTGFALTSNGFIATNYHVIENANSIKVRGVNGNFSSALNAQVIKSDQSDDLAIIQINDPNFTDLGKVPYPVVSSNSDVGEEVFALGYPLTNTMGIEVKLTTGVISANSGYQGNPTQYQISVPVQPGNSGGPLFDKNGRIVGIVNAKHLNTDNVSYAIKSGNLLGLFYMIPETPVLDANFMTGKSLPDKVKQAKNFVYIIEVNK